MFDLDGRRHEVAQVVVVEKRPNSEQICGFRSIRCTFCGGYRPSRCHTAMYVIQKPEASLLASSSHCWFGPKETPPLSEYLFAWTPTCKAYISAPLNSTFQPNRVGHYMRRRPVLFFAWQRRLVQAQAGGLPSCLAAFWHHFPSLSMRNIAR